MPRRARKYLKELPYHIVQRGNNREACFIEEENYRFYLELWEKIARQKGVAVHAWCLMTNHIHFLLTPQDETGISETLKMVGSRYAQYINKKYKRTGTMWEGRHRSSLVQEGKYLLSCYRYIELNPVRANMVQRPEEYVWSSYGVNGWGDESWITPHVEYSALGQTTEERCHAYRSLFKYQISEEDLHLFRKAAHYSQPVGDDRFRKQIEEKYGIKFGNMGRGRPRKQVDALVNK
ncbi:MAG: transposase [Gammaproteobacteria bacterium]|nr:transposase [Gammaproteobacteria bacterium]